MAATSVEGCCLCRGPVPGAGSGGQLDQGPSIEQLQCARCCAKPFTHLISCGSCLLLFQQCSNVNIQKLLLPGSLWNASGTCPLLSYPRTPRRLRSLKGAIPSANSRWRQRAGVPYLYTGTCCCHKVLLLGMYAALSRGHSPLPALPCTGREALNLDTRSHPSWLLIISSGRAQC